MSKWLPKMAAKIAIKTRKKCTKVLRTIPEDHAVLHFFSFRGQRTQILNFNIYKFKPFFSVAGFSPQDLFLKLRHLNVDVFPFHSFTFFLEIIRVAAFQQKFWSSEIQIVLKEMTTIPFKKWPSL